MIAAYARWLGIAAVLAAAAPVHAKEGRLCFLAHEGGYWQVWTMTSSGKDVRGITRSPSDKTRCSWFPDGTRILVDSSEGRLFSVDVATGAETQLPLSLGPTTIERPLKGLVDAVLSPDGRRIAFSLSLPTETDRNRIWIADSDGRNAKKLTREGVLQHEPAWSPDGSFLYYSAGDGGQSHDLRRLEVATGQMEQLTAGELYHFDVAVSSTGDLAYSSNRGGNYEIWVLRKGAKEPFAVTDDPGADGRPTWSPDGAIIVFDSTRGGGPNLWSVQVGTKGAVGEPVRLTDHAIGARSPAWWQGGAR